MNHEDKDWHERTESRIVNLTNGETVQNDRLDDIDERLEEVTETLRGNHAKGYAGLIQELEEVSRTANMYRAILSPDALGNGGILNRLKEVEEWKRDADRDKGYRWKYWTSVSAAVIALFGLLLTNLDRIADGFHKIAPNSPIFAKPVKPKKPIKPKRKVVKPCDPDLEECLDITAQSQAR